MVKINLRWTTAEDFNLLRGTSAWTKTKYFWRKGWIEIPVIMASSIAATIGAGLMVYAYWYIATHDMTPKYFKTPRIYRPDDPAVQKIRYVSSFDK